MQKKLKNMNISIIYAFMYACQIDFMKYLLQCYNVHCKKKKKKKKV